MIFVEISTGALFEMFFLNIDPKLSAMDQKMYTIGNIKFMGLNAPQCKFNKKNLLDYFEFIGFL